MTPYDVTVSSDKKMWWICREGHEWENSIAKRNVNITCPYCNKQTASNDYNFYIYHAELCEEWDYVKNHKYPTEYTPSSHQKVWWKCRKCNHGWETSINSRVSGNGCPICRMSKGEKNILKFLKLHGITHVCQQTFESLIGLGGNNLSYDFYLPNKNILIEFQGHMHERFVKGIHKTEKDFEKQKEHDRRKREYAQNNDINLLEIWYYDMKNIPQILSQHLNIQYKVGEQMA